MRLLKPERLTANWNPEADARLTLWEMVHHLIRMLGGEDTAAEALSYNGLVHSWPDITRLARESGKPQTRATLQ